MPFEPLEGRTLLAGSGLAAAYFARTNDTLIKFSRIDQAINFAWSGGTPARSLGTDGFSTRWTGLVAAKFSETHTFIATSTGGIRVWVNNILIIDDNALHSLKTDQGSLRLSAGRKYDIRIDYWSDGNNPSVKLEWQSARMARGVVPTSRLYPDRLDKISPATPSHLRTTSTSQTSISIAWDASTDPSNVVAYDLYVGKSKVGTTAPGQTSYSRSRLKPQTGYTFSVQAIDAAGNLSGKATTAVTTAAPPAQTPPTTPAGLHVVSSTSTSITLAWNASTDDGTVTGYRVYRDGVKLPVAPHDPTFTDTGLSPGTTYTYVIRAADDSSLFSGSSAPLIAQTPAAATHSAFSTISANSFDDASGIATSGSDLVNLDDGDWVKFSLVNFGTGANSVFVQLALDPSNRGGWIELHLDSVGGTTVGVLGAQPTGSWNTYQSEQVNIDNVSGSHDLYVVFKGRTGVANFRSIQFSENHLTRIMALGDSITQQSSASPSYRYYLWHSLQTAGYGVDFVGGQTQPWDAANPPNFDFDQDHEGHANFRADQIASAVGGWASVNVPDVVLLHVGTNDVKSGQSAGSTISDIEQIITNLRSVNPNVKILLAQIIPCVGFDSGVNELNALIPDIEASMSTASSPISVVDMNTNFPGDGLGPDGTHPNSTGDAFIAQKWYTALQSVLQ